MRCNYYNLYQHNKLIKSDIPSREVESITGLEVLNLVNLAKYNSTFGDGYTVEINRKVVTKAKEGQTKDDEFLKIWDDKTKTFTHENIARKEVCKMFKIDSYRLAQYMKKMYYINDRYLVSRADKKEMIWPQDLIDRWNEVRQAAELLRTGKGKIVRKKVKGKYIKYTEVTG